MIQKCWPLLKEKWWLPVIFICLGALVLLPSDHQGMTQEEKRISQALSQVAGAGKVQVTVYYSETASAFGGGEKTCVGAVAVCEGAGDVFVQLNIARALETLLGLEANDVVVLKMEETK